MREMWVQLIDYNKYMKAISTKHTCVVRNEGNLMSVLSNLFT